MDSEPIFQVHLSILKFLQLLETVKYEGMMAEFFNCKEFHSPMYKFLEILVATLKKGKEHSLSSQWLSFVRNIIFQLERIIDEYQNQFPNFFGERNDEIAEKELDLLLDFASWLTHEECAFSDRFQWKKLVEFYSEIETDNELETVNDADCHLHLVTRLFWLRYFGLKTECSWTEFETAFESEYEINSRELMTRFRTVIGEETIRWTSLCHLLPKDRSLFSYIQDVCDPNTTVVLCGHFCDSTIRGNSLSLHYPQPTVMRHLLGHSIASISCGDQHCAVITRSGVVFTWGKGAFGRLGHGTTEDVAQPRVVHALTTDHHGDSHSKTPLVIVEVSCGFAFTGFVSETGRVYMCGAGMNGRLGLGNSDTDVLQPTLLTTLLHEHVIMVQNGSVHSVILTKRGAVYSCGKADYAGHGTTSDVRSPQLIRALSSQFVTSIAVGSGGFHTLALTDTGALYAWGHNRVGQLGIACTATLPRTEDGGCFVPEPQPVEDHPAEIISISAGWGHSAVVTKYGEVFLCGRNVEGQLGLDPQRFGNFINERGHRYHPFFQSTTEGDLQFKKVSQAACGGEHSIFLANDCDVIGVGLANRGQLGGQLGGIVSQRQQTAAGAENANGDANANNQQHVNAMLVPNTMVYARNAQRKVLQISCGYNSTMMLVTSKRQVPSLRSLCSRVIRTKQTLWEQVLKWKGETEEQHNHGAAMDMDVIGCFGLVSSGLPPSSTSSASSTVQGVRLDEESYLDDKEEYSLERSAIFKEMILNAMT
jgi:alpha-tubulin suppressor-like RCC1 family protein